MERKKRSKGSVWEFCYANKIFGTFGVEMRECGQKLVKFCTLTHAAKLVVRLQCFTQYRVSYHSRYGFQDISFLQRMCYLQTQI